MKASFFVGALLGWSVVIFAHIVKLDMNFAFWLYISTALLAAPVAKWRTLQEIFAQSIALYGVVALLLAIGAVLGYMWQGYMLLGLIFVAAVYGLALAMTYDSRWWVLPFNTLAAIAGAMLANVFATAFAGNL